MLGRARAPGADYASINVGRAALLFKRQQRLADDNDGGLRSSLTY